MRDLEVAPLLLTADELQALTGKRRADAQRRALESMRVPYRERPDRTLAVLRSAAERALGGEVTIASPEPELQP